MKNYFLLGLALLPLLVGAQNTRAFYDTKSIAEVRVKMDAKNWGDVLDSMRIMGEYLAPATVTVDGARYENVGIRYIGDKSYVTGQKRNPVLIRLNENNPEQTHQGYQYIYLSSALRDPSMVREVLSHEIARKYMPSPQANYARLYLNDEYIGLFVNLELPTKAFQERYFQDSGNLLAHARIYARDPEGVNCKKNLYGSLEYESDLACYPANFRRLNGNSYANIQELTRVLNQEPENIEKILAVDEALWMLALNNVMVNLSSYTGISSNYFLYQDAEGRFHPIHWDLNLSFGSFKNTGNGSDLDEKGLIKLDPMLHADNMYKPLISKLLANPLYKKMYLAHMRQILEENFSNGAYEKRAKELQGQIVVPFSDDRNKQYTLDEFQGSLRTTIGKKSKIPGIVELMSKRTEYLKTNTDLSALPSTISQVQLQNRVKFDAERLKSFNFSAQADRFPQRLFLHYRFDPAQPYQVVSMEEEAGSELSPGVKKFKTSVKAPSDDAAIHYYIIAENAGMASFYPVNYTQKPATAKLAELNK